MTPASWRPLTRPSAWRNAASTDGSWMVSRADRSVEESLVGEQGGEHRHGLPGADPGQFLAGVRLFFQGRVRL